MKKVLLLVLLSLLTYTCFAGNISFVWDHSESSGVSGYKIYYGTKSRNYTNYFVLPYINGTSISKLQDGVTYYFAVCSYVKNADGSILESDFTPEIRCYFPNPTLSLPSGVNGFSVLEIK